MTKILVDNAHPRRDVYSDILDAHDGCLKVFDGKYYLYGTRYGNTDGLGKENQYVVYSSPNLTDWTPHGEILVNVPQRLYFRPHVVYNKETRKYVLWYNADAKMGVATADRPTGPFTEICGDLALRHRDIGDLALFADTGGTAYVTYSYSDGTDPKETFPISREPIPHHQIVVEQLTADYLASAGHVTEPVAGNSEAPALFRRGDLYYLLFDNTCGFCTSGTGVRVYLSHHPLGPYAYKGNINRAGLRSRDLPSPWTEPATGRADAIIRAQQTHVAVLPGCEGDQYLWMGDRWGSSPDGIKGHDFQNWAVLSFDQDGMIRQLEHRDTWTLELAAE